MKAPQLNIYTPKSSDPETARAFQTIQKYGQNVEKAFAAFPFSYYVFSELRLTQASFPVKVALRGKPPAKSVLLGYLQNMTDPPGTGAPPGACFVDWIPEGEGINIRYITGLTPGKSYTVRLEIKG